MLTKKTIVEPPNLSIITIAFKINSELFRCLNSCKFSKISIEHILVFPRKEYKKARLKFIIIIKYYLIMGMGFITL